MAIIQVGQEPQNIKKRIDTLFSKLDEEYPEKVIVALQRDHKKWDETAREISKQLGYESKNEFLTAYGYRIEKAGTGRPRTTNYTEVIDELKRRYPDGASFTKLGELVEANLDLKSKLKTISNESNELFGMSMKDYFVSIGLIAKAEADRSGHKELLDDLVASLRMRYENRTDLPEKMGDFKKDNADLPLSRLNYVKDVYGLNPAEYLISEGLMKESSRAVSDIQADETHSDDIYAKELEAWEKECEEIRVKRQSAVEERLNAEKKTLELPFQRAFDTEIQSANKQKSDAEKRKAEIEKQISKLGVFDFMKKKSLKKEFEKLEAEALTAENRIKSAKHTLKISLASVNQKLSQTESEICAAVEEEFPLPSMPQKPGDQPKE